MESLLKIITAKPEDTKQAASLLAKLVQPGDLLLLQGDLGAGKTTFTKGLALGLGIKHRVKSPTFNLVNEYHQGRLPLYHLDVYRLEKTGAADLGFEEYFDGAGVSVVEWPQFIKESLPAEFLLVKLLRKTDEINDLERIIELRASGLHYQQLLKKYQQLLITKSPAWNFMTIPE